MPPLPPFDPEMGNPVVLRKKTVRIFDPEKLVGKDPLLVELVKGQTEATEDRNTMFHSMEWNNKLGILMWKRLNDGDALLTEVRFIRKCVIYGGGSVGAVLVTAAGIILAAWFNHLMKW